MNHPVMTFWCVLIEHMMADMRDDMLDWHEEVSAIVEVEL